MARDERDAREDARGRGRAAFWRVPRGTLYITPVMTRDRPVHRLLLSHHSWTRAPRRNETKRTNLATRRRRARPGLDDWGGGRGGGRGRTTRVATRNEDEYRRRSRRNGRPGRTETPRREAARCDEATRRPTRVNARARRHSHARAARRVESTRLVDAMFPIDGCVTTNGCESKNARARRATTGARSIRSRSRDRSPTPTRADSAVTFVFKRAPVPSLDTADGSAQESLVSSSHVIGNY